MGRVFGQYGRLLRTWENETVKLIEAEADDS